MMDAARVLSQAREAASLPAKGDAIYIVRKLKALLDLMILEAGEGEWDE